MGKRQPLYGKAEADCLEVREMMQDDHIKYGLLIEQLGTCKRIVDIGADRGQFLSMAQGYSLPLC